MTASSQPVSSGLASADRPATRIFFDDVSPYLGYETGWDTFLSLRVLPRWRSRIFFDTNRFVDVRNTNDDLVFDVKILRTLNTYQFTDRLLFRNIMEYNSFDRRLNLNVLFTYRVNAGTVFYVGYDDRYQQADRNRTRYQRLTGSTTGSSSRRTSSARTAPSSPNCSTSSVTRFRR